MPAHDPDLLQSLIGKTSHRQDIWLWLYFKQFEEADFELDTCNGLTMRSNLAGFIESKGGVTAELIAAMDRFLVDVECLKWISGEERQTKWLDHRVRSMTRLGDLWSIPRLTGRDLLIGAIDLWEESVTHKTAALKSLHRDWERHRSQDRQLKWFEDNKEGAARCRFAWEWLQKDRALALRIPPSFESYIELVMYFDSMDLRERELKDIAQSIRRSWNRQRYLEKLEGKKQYNFILSEESVELLDELASASGLKRPQVLERLIKAEADRRGQLAPFHTPSNSG